MKLAPELFYRDGEFVPNQAVLISDEGLIEGVEDASLHPDARPMPHRALLPGLVNAHSHAFQRVFRGATETPGDFWSWRKAMYEAANRFDADGLYDASKLTFREMAHSGITTVGEFHYIHRDRDGRAYSDPNLLALAVVQAARDVGLRIGLLRAAYARAGFDKPTDPEQRRFIEPTPEEFLRNAETLRKQLDGQFSWLGVAPHSIRAVPMDYLRKVAHWAERERIPLHMHVSEQPAELDACRAEYGTTPVSLLAREGILNSRFTAVHAIHISDEEIRQLADSGAAVCACPTTERNLGDGIVAADKLLAAGVPVLLGTDSQAQIDLLEDARELEYHLRLIHLRRGILDPAELFRCATVFGAKCLGAPERGADFFTVDLLDDTLRGMPINVMTVGKSAVREVIVGGRFVVG